MSIEEHFKDVSYVVLQYKDSMYKFNTLFHFVNIGEDCIELKSKYADIHKGIICIPIKVNFKANIVNNFLTDIYLEDSRYKLSLYKEHN